MKKSNIISRSLILVISVMEIMMIVYLIVNTIFKESSLCNNYKYLITKIFGLIPNWITESNFYNGLLINSNSNELITLSVFLFAGLILSILFFELNSDKLMSSRKCLSQVLGSLSKNKTNGIIFLIIVLSIGLAVILHISGSEEERISAENNSLLRILIIIPTTLILYIVYHVIKNLNKIFSLRKQETKITWSQIILLISFCIWTCIFVSCLDINKDSNGYLFISIGGVVLGWIFQDTIKSIVAFFYLRANNLLKIGDWIEVKNHGIDGMVKGISLTMVEIENWDTTTSAFPTYILHSEHFKNYQKMVEGQTLGRQMMKTFILDTSWIHLLSNEDILRLKRELDIDDYFKDTVLKSSKLNIEAFRLYIYHWLMRNSHISQEPRLIVRWMEQTAQGLPLQVYAFIIDCSLASFEWQQSQIIEHIIKSLTLFDIQLYQTPSGYDASNLKMSINNSHKSLKEYAKLQK